MRKKEISLPALGMFSVVLLVILLWKKQLDFLSSLFGAMAGVAVLFLSKITREQIGMGDGVFITVLGILIGWRGIAQVTLYGFAFAGVFSIGVIIFLKIKGKNRIRKTTIPLIPFLFLGYLYAITMQ